MCELLACKAKNDAEEDDFITEVLEGGNLKFSNTVRRVAFDILSTYKGPSSVCIAVSMLVCFDVSNKKVLVYQIELLIPTVK